jgi:uncharacterized protein YpmB
MLKKWFVFLFILLILVLFIGIALYISAQQDKHHEVNEKVAFIKDEMNVTIEKMERFHGEQLYYVFTVKEEDNSAYYLFVDEENNIERIAFQDIELSKEEVPRAVRDRYPEIREIKRITPAYTEYEFTWEILASDKNNQLQYLYFKMEDGSFLKRYKLISH